jgi:hypothetical protein
MNLTAVQSIFIVKRTTNSKLPCNDDFKRRLDDFDYNKFHDEEVKTFKIGKIKIYFIGDGKHGGLDYAFLMKLCSLKISFDQVKCVRKFCGLTMTHHLRIIGFDNALGRPDVAF